MAYVADIVRFNVLNGHGIEIELNSVIVAAYVPHFESSEIAPR